MAFENLKPKLNKPAKEGYTYRSPNQTNAKSYLPHPKEDVIASQSADNARIKKGLDAPAERAYNRLQQQEAGGKALTRTTGRAGAAGAALEGGYELGRYIDEKTGLGKKMVDKSGLGDLAAKAATSGERVTLTKDAQSRIDRGDLDEKPVKRSVSRTTVSAEPAHQMKEEKDYGPDIRDDIGPLKEPSADNMLKRGGRVHASKRADGIAQRGHTRYRGDKH